VLRPQVAPLPEGPPSLPGGFEGLDALGGIGGRSSEGLCACTHLVRDLPAPVGQGAIQFEGNRRDRLTPYVANQAAEWGDSAACLATKNQGQGLPLPLIGARVEEESRRPLRLAGPRVPRKPRDHTHVQIAEGDSTVVTVPHMVRKDALTVISGRRLRKLARTREVTTTNIKPVTKHTPVRDRQARLLWGDSVLT